MGQINSRCVNKVSAALASKSDQYIKWPSEQRKRDIKQGFYDNGGFPGVIGCVDSTHVRIAAPSSNEPSFVNRKGFHSINVQAICDNEELRLQLEKVCALIIACAVLHNSSIEMREPMEDPDDEVLMFWNINIDFRGPGEGRVVRDHIARTFFA
ncbi:putative nuclease HARBI1 [Mytilus edulis]|uniref:putative nuclease HARBI1 n=1 Tax=Mytilus edulis TaxID=6550 RepID=UPI0039EF3988